MGLVATSLVAAWGLADAYNAVGNIPRFDVAEDALVDPDSDTPGEPRNFLLIGSTENAGIDPDDRLVEVRDDTMLADTIMVLRVEPATGRAMLLTINRDLRIPDGPWGYSGMVNGAYTGGDPATLIAVVRDYLDIPINNVIKVNFAGFRGLVDEIDGVPVHFDAPMKDDESGFVAPGGCSVLDGAMALDYVRSRKMQVESDGRYERADGWSDLDRTTRQRDFLVLTARRAIEKGARDPRRLRQMIDAVNDDRAVELDPYLTPDDLIDISGSFEDFDPERLQRYAVATVPDPRDPNRLLVDDAANFPIVELFNGREGSSSNRAVVVDVREARAPADRSSDVAPPADELRAREFTVRTSTAMQADRRERTTISYSADQALAALTVARNVATHVLFEPLPSRGQLTLHIGTDWSGVTLVPKAPEEFAGEIESAPSVTATEAPTGSTAAPPGTGPSVQPSRAAIIGEDPAGGLCDPDR
jgi:LCP family protein required for cell wall assembly